MSRNIKKTAKDFLIGFFATAVLMLPLFFGAYKISELRRETQSGTLEAGESRTDVPISAPLSFNLLFTLSDSLTGELVSVSLIRIDTGSKAVNSVTFPSGTVVLWDKTPMTLYSIFAQRSALGVKSAVSDTLSVPVSGYISVTSDMLSEMIDKLGGFEFTLERAIEVKDVDGRTVYSRESGTSVLYGPDVMQLTINSGYSGIDLARLRERLWSAALNKLCTGEKSAETVYSGITSAAGKSTDNDLGAAMLGSIKRAADYALGPGCLVAAVRPEGVYSDGKFELSEGADQKLWGYFSKV